MAKQDYRGAFSAWSKNDPTGHQPSISMSQGHYFQQDFWWNWLRKERTVPAILATPWNIKKMSTSNCFIPCIYHNWKSTEINYIFFGNFEKS